MRKKLTALFLTFCLALMPFTPVFAEDGDGTAENPFTSVTAYNQAIAGDSLDGKDVYLTIKGSEDASVAFTSSHLFNLTNTQQRPNPPKLHLTLEYCSFTGNTAGDSTNPSFMYLPNCQSLVMENCEFDTGEEKLKYGINWNLCGIQDATVEIRNCTFKGNYEKNALKLNQRNGEDDKAQDVKPSSGDPKPASISKAIIENCTFSGTNAVIQLGSQGKGEQGAAAPSTGAFPVTISNVQAGTAGSVKVELAYQAANGKKFQN